MDDFGPVYNLMVNNCGRSNGVVFQCKTATVTKPVRKAETRDYARRFTSTEAFARAVTMPWRMAQAS
jgi:hypothetical protein